ncbi:MAG: hypothetical protein ACRD6B_01885, partial [Bryobacteraceae bacterium]
TRVNTEQASKQSTWEPTRQRDGEGRRRRVHRFFAEEARSMSEKALRSHRGNGDGMPVQGSAAQHGKPQGGGKGVREEKVSEGEEEEKGVRVRRHKPEESSE